MPRPQRDRKKTTKPPDKPVPNPENDPDLDATEAFLMFCVEEAPEDDSEAVSALAHHRFLKDHLWFWQHGIDPETIIV